MSQTIINTQDAPAAIGPYVQARRVGPFLYTSGQIPIDPKTGDVVEGIEAQTEQALNNLLAILKAAGFDKEHVLKTTVFIKDMNQFATINGIYERFFGDHKPARSCVEVARLPKDVLVEVEAVAYGE
ncbi:RidA family protein [Gallaecimonas pentaromativorans]|uniref:2-iminobutanoate/2-iminopropanoate deaminase n=1 Tax=Gallaecimonas pentaromativorans TaxID=584787 RepID=A0A3N1P8X5_9GAMM|nr:RidA family protein [Gallaecimonas pentaromativorans]MED5525764.1 RidA family protein [Pseudomonadota bacterium]ROQ25005.1 2-iminobutanoate/2-iminopropanoate deaminase [Gallaecimonas pentaromativorans]